MKRYLLAPAILMTMLCLAAPAGAQETGFNYAQGTGTTNIDTLSTATPNVLRTVVIKCPAAGYLVATASALFTFSVGTSFPGTIAYSISVDSSSFDAAHQHSVYGSYVDDFHVFPATMQRVTTCADKQNVTFRFLATNGSGAYDTTAKQARMVVVFYRDRLNVRTITSGE